VMATLVGREGSGKSHTAIRMAYELDPTFLTDQIIYDVVDLLRRLSSGEHSQGDVFVLDEAGVSLGRRTWQDRGQVLANEALQLIRSHNLGLFFTVPRLSELDSQTVGRLHAFYEIVDKVDGKHVSGKWKWLDPDRTDQTGKIYRKYPRRRKNGQTLRITRLKFCPPRPGLVEQYEAEKEEFQSNFYEEVLEELSDEGDDDNDGRKPKDIAVEILADDSLEEYVMAYNNGAQKVIDKDLIAAEYDLGIRRAKTVKKILQKEVEDNAF